MKKLRPWLITLLLSAVAVAADAPAGPRVRLLVYGVDDLAQCAKPVRLLQAELPTLDFPDGWIIGVVCTPTAWESILKIADPPPTQTAFTNFVRHSTVLNAAIFRQPRHQYRRTLAHELGHVICRCADENQAERLARTFEHGPLAIAQPAPAPRLSKSLPATK